jgi:hypothetical protein
MKQMPLVLSLQLFTSENKLAQNTLLLSSLEFCEAWLPFLHVGQIWYQEQQKASS